VVELIMANAENLKSKSKTEVQQFNLSESNKVVKKV
jgi:hypothetical protein